MRRVLPAGFLVVALALAAAPAGAQPDILNRPPMDLGADQTGVLQSVVNDLLYPYQDISNWFEFGVSYPQGALADQNWDAGLLLRGNHKFWRNGSCGLVGSFGVNFANDSYFNDAQDDYGNTAGVGAIIQTRHYLAWPAMVNLELAPNVGSGVKPFISAGPGVVWSSEALITSAINDGVGSTTTGSGSGGADTLVIGPGGEQGVSPFDIKTRTRFNLGWNARAGVGLKVGHGDRPMWVRAVLSGTTYYQHTAPRTLLGVTASLGR